MNKIPFVLTIFGLPHATGRLAAQSGAMPENPFDTLGFLDFAAELGVAGVEMPIPKMEMSREAFRDALRSRELMLSATHSTIVERDVANVETALRDAAFVGARVMRTTLSKVLCGERAKQAGGWQERLDAVAERLRAVLPLAEELGVAVCLENHQDATSDELIQLHEQSGQSRAFGVTLDAGNPLAVGEEPVAAARKLAPLIRHAHLKDYMLHRDDAVGYHLVRCVAGQGVVDFPAILEILRANGNSILPGIEIAAQPTRTIPILRGDWWKTFSDSHITQNAEILFNFVERHAQPWTNDSPSPWERGADSDAIVADELRVVEASVAYFRSLTESPTVR